MNYVHYVPNQRGRTNRPYSASVKQSENGTAQDAAKIEEAIIHKWGNKASYNYEL